MSVRYEAVAVRRHSRNLGHCRRLNESAGERADDVRDLAESFSAPCGLAAVRVLGALGALMGARFSASDKAESEWLRLPDQALRPE